jgi:hypothetical protein
MAATYVTAATLKASLGVGTLYDSYTWIEDTCQTAEDLINQFLEFDSAPVVAASLTNNVATLVLANSGIFVTGQTITVSACGSIYNGSKVITGTFPAPSGNIASLTMRTWPYNNFPTGYSYVQYAKTNADDPYHLIKPYGTALGPDTKTFSYANTVAIQAAALMLAENIWTSRFSTQNGASGIDGYTPSNFKMSNTLMASVRGLLAPYLNATAMIG